MEEEKSRAYLYIDKKKGGIGWYLSVHVNANQEDGSYMSFNTHVTRQQLTKLHEEIGEALQVPEDDS